MGWEGSVSSIGLIAAAIGTLSMLMSEPKAKSNAIEDTHSMFVLSLVTYAVSSNITLHTHLWEWFWAKSPRTIPCHETAITWFFLLQRWRNLIWFIRFRCLWSFLAWRFLYNSFVLRFLRRDSFLWTLLSVSNWSLRDSSCCFRRCSCCSFSCKPASRCGLRNTLWCLPRVRYAN